MDKYNSRSITALFIVCILLIHTAKAQPTGKWVLKPDFLAVFQHTPAFQLRTERKATNSTSIQLTTGFCYGTFYSVFNDLSSLQYDAKNMMGFSGKLEYRYYLQDTTNSLQGIYVAPEIGYKHLTYQQGRYFDIFTPTYNYTKLMEYTVNRQTYSYHIKLGWQKQISKRLYIDTFGGIGRRIIVMHNNLKIPDDATYIEEDNSSIGELYWGYKGTKTRLSGVGSILIGFMF
jgi:hypothetical protein